METRIQSDNDYEQYPDGYVDGEHDESLKLKIEILMFFAEKKLDNGIKKKWTKRMFHVDV